MRRPSELWWRWSQQFGTRTVRERVMMASGVVVVVVGLFDSMVLSPLEVQYKRISGQLAETRASIKAGEQIMASGKLTADPDEIKRRYRDELRKQISEVDGKLQGLQKQLVPPDQVAYLLEGVLTRDRGLALVSLHKFPVQRFQTGGAIAKGDSKGAGGDRIIYQHSFEIEVEGSYVELYGYLARLEKLPWQLFWGRVILDAANNSRLKLTLKVQTLSMNKEWLVI